jgi:hypothetical protein
MSGAIPLLSLYTFVACTGQLYMFTVGGIVNIALDPFV